MKIAFIKPNMFPEPSSDALQPLAFAVLAGLTSLKHEVRLYDERVEVLPETIDADIAAISVETFTARRAYQLASRLRRQGLHIVMGGYHSSFLPEESLLFCDTVLVGEAEDVWPLFLQDVEAGCAKKIYRSNEAPELKNILYERSIFKGKQYASIYPVQFGRGCRFACDFCSIHAFYPGEPRQRSVNEVIAEIESLGKKYIFIVDDNIAAYKEQAIEFFKALMPLKIRWISQASMDVTGDDEILDLMAESGCMALVIGFESLRTENLRRMNKSVNISENSPEAAIARLRQRGIMVYGTFIFGYDFDTSDMFEKTLNFAVQNKLALANFNPLMPTPGTRLYTRLEEEGRLLYRKWWLDNGFSYGDAMFRPRMMTPEELSQGCFDVRRKFNRFSTIIRRALDRKANAANLSNLAMFSMANFMSRKEIYRKQGACLGEDRTSLQKAIL